MANDLNEIEIKLRLVSIIEKHMPSTSEPYPDGLAISKPSELHAEKLTDTFKAPLLPFGLGPSEAEWQRVRKAATELQRALHALKAEGLREIHWQSPLWWDAEKPLGHEAYFVAEILKDAARKMEKKRRAGLKAGNKRDWKGAALAKVARQIWAETEWESKPEKYGRLWNMLADMPVAEREHAGAVHLAYARHLESFAPRTEKLDSLGPFGCFLGDVLICFGCDISPASALRSMSDAQKLLDRVGRNTSEI